MSVITLRLEPTRDGAIALYAKPEVFTGHRPVVVMVHGALRNAAFLRPWKEAFEPDSDLVLIDLPGHNRGPAILPATVETIALNLADALTSALPGREVVLVGESLGGLVAIAVAGLPVEPLRAVLAADPPLTVSKLWHVRQSFERHLTKNPSNHYARRLGEDVFGVSGETQSERIYYPLIGQVRVPTHIVTGDIPLFPPRDFPVLACVIDDVDRFVLQTFYAGKVQVHTLAHCNHLALIDQQAQCLELIRRIQADAR